MANAYVIVHDRTYRNRCVSLLDVHASQSHGGNVALNKSTIQPSTFGGLVASWAVDGRYDTRSCTDSHVKPWWAVDLGAEYDVVRVTVTNDDSKSLCKYR